MQTIPETYKQAHYAMKLVKRDWMAAMYKAGHDNYWEVHQVRIGKAVQIKGKQYPEREILAGNEDFGTYAWACGTLERAEERFAEVLDSLKAKEEAAGMSG